MVAIGRALMARPRLLLLDEPSLGLAPMIVTTCSGRSARSTRDGVAVLLVEQNVAMALAIARRAYVLEEGRIVAEGEPRQLMSQRAYPEGILGNRGVRTRMGYRITLKPSGHSYEAEEGKNILQAGLDAGHMLPYSCRAGVCRTCRGTILEGKVDYGLVHDDLPARERQGEGLRAALPGEAALGPGDRGARGPGRGGIRRA